MRYEIRENQIVIPACQQTRHMKVSAFLDEYRQSKKNRWLLTQNQRLLLDEEPVRDLEEEIGERELRIVIPEEEPDWPMANEPARVVYEDPFVDVVHKPAGIIIHGDPDDTECLNALAARYQYENSIKAPVRPLHRLDKDTQGLVMYSKIPFFQPWLDSQMENKEIRRHYLAVCYGKGEPGTKFTCNEPLAKDRHRSGVWRIAPNGLKAVTRAEILEKKGKYLLIGCELETGRTHQIRIHLANRRYPIINDPLYGIASRDFDIMGLWADEITFRSPLTRKKHKIHDIPVKEYAYFDYEEK